MPVPNQTWEIPQDYQIETNYKPLEHIKVEPETVKLPDMHILKKTEMGDSKKNYFADTAPDTKTYDLDKMVAKRKATKHVGLGKSQYEHNGIQYETYSDYRQACIDEFLVTYPPLFMRKEYPSSAIVNEDTIQWNKEWIQSIYMTETWHYFTRRLEAAICKWYLKDVDTPMMDRTAMDTVLQEALASIYDKLNKAPEENNEKE